MKKPVYALARILAVLLLLAGLSMCTMPGGPAESPPEDALSFDELLANLDELTGSATQSPSAPGKSVFSLPNGSLLGSADLSAYINAIKRDLAAYIYACTGGAPYLVVASRVHLADTGSTSGLVWVPFTWGRTRWFPIISLQHGTQVLRECAPSNFNANPLAILWARDLTGALQNYVECVVGALMASAGYIVVMPDYQGFGESLAIHPYVHLSLGESVHDIVDWATGYFVSPRAARANGSIFLTGYSEGGYTTMAGARSLSLDGTAVTRTIPCDGAYSLSKVMRDQMTTGEQIPAPHYLLYTASGYKAAEPTMPGLSTFLTDVSPTFWATKAGTLFKGTCTNAVVSSAVPPSTIPLDMLIPSEATKLKNNSGDVYPLLVKNDAWQGWAPAHTAVPSLVLIHCPEDDVVPYGNAEEVQTHYALQGIGVPIVPVPYVPFIESVLGTKHVAAFPAAMLAAFKAIRY